MIKFVPRSYQWGFCRELATESRRHFLEVWPRRHGKDRCFINASLQIMQRRACTVWHGFPTYAQGRKALLDPDANGRRLVDDLLDAGGALNKQELTVAFPNGALYRAIGTDHYNTVVGAPPYVIGYSEWSRCDPMARQYFLPMLLENGGIEAFMSTVFGENHCTAMADVVCNNPDWHYSFYTIDGTQRDAPGERGGSVITQAELDALVREWIQSGGESGMSPEMVAQEFYNDRTGVNTGKVFGEELRAARNEGRITSVPHDPSLLVHTFWDRGVHNRIWFAQRSGPWWHLIDYLDTDNSALPAIVNLMRKDHRAAYTYGLHVVARDAWDPVPGHIESFVKQGRKLGIRFKKAPNLRFGTGLNAAKAVFALCRFDEERCKKGLSALDRYHYEWDDKKKRFGKEPVRDVNAHAADAFRYFAVGRPDARQSELAAEDAVPPDADYITAMQARSARTGPRRNTLSRNYRRR